MEVDANGYTNARYLNEPELHGQLISQIRNGRTYCYHNDGLNNTGAVTDENENVVETATYSAFGEVAQKTSSIVNPFGYKGAVGYYVNPAVNNFDVRARVYEPSVARWLSPDPMEFDSGDTNLYRYVFNRPLELCDPSGLTCIVCKWYRHTNGDDVVKLDDVFKTATPYSNFSDGVRIKGRNPVIAAQKIQYTTPWRFTGPHQAKPNTGNFIDNGVLFYLSADVCETKPGDCKVDFQETQLWRAESRGATSPYILIAPGRGTNKIGFSPSAFSNPSINELDRQYGPCNKRIVLGDFTADQSTLRPPSFKALGGLQTMRIYDNQGNSSTMRHRFGWFTRRTPPHDIEQWISRGSSDAVPAKVDCC